MPRNTRKMKKQALQQILPETLQANMTELKQSCFRHMVRRQGPLDKTVMLRK